MVNKLLKKLIKEKRKEQLTTVRLECPSCKILTYVTATAIQEVGIKKEFERQHNHKKSIVKRVINKIGGDLRWILHR
jgi:hypothetical protein